MQQVGLCGTAKNVSGLLKGITRRNNTTSTEVGSVQIMFEPGAFWANLVLQCQNSVMCHTN